MARLYLARLAEPGARPAPEPDRPLMAAVRARTPADPAAPDGWPYGGVTVSQGFAVWEVSAARDARLERRLVVVAAEDRDRELTAWAWTTRARGLPLLGKYLLHAARLRYQLYVWSAAGSAGRLRDAVDAAVTELLERTAAPYGPGREADLLRATRALVGLQARERGLVDRSTRSREMARTVEIAAANLAALGGPSPGGARPGGPFADDHALAEWFGRRLDDEATYLEAALRRCEQVGAFTDQLLQRAGQRRQETVNLGLTGAVGAVLMSLTAIQSLQYTVPLPGPVKPAAVTSLGALALLVSLVVLRVVSPERRWTAVLVGAGAAALGAALAWTAMSAAGVAGAGWTWTGGEPERPPGSPSPAWCRAGAVEGEDRTPRPRRGMRGRTPMSYSVSWNGDDRSRWSANSEHRPSRQSEQPPGHRPSARPPATATSTARELFRQGMAAHARFRDTGERRHLDTCIDLLGRAVSRSLPGGPGLTAFSNNLGVALFDRYKLGQKTAGSGPHSGDLDQALEHLLRAYRNSPPDSPTRARATSGLFHAYEARLARSEPLPGDLERRLPSFRSLRREVGRTPGVAVQVRLRAAYESGRSAADTRGPAAGYRDLATAVTLLPRALWGAREEMLEVLADHPGLASEAAACALDAGDTVRAVQLLEHGRAILWKQHTQARSPREELWERRPRSARLLDRLHVMLEPRIHVPAGSADSRVVSQDVRMEGLAGDGNPLVRAYRLLSSGLRGGAAGDPRSAASSSSGSDCPGRPGPTTPPSRNRTTTPTSSPPRTRVPSSTSTSARGTAMR